MIIKGGLGGQILTGSAENDTIYGYDPAELGSINVTPVVTSGLSQPLYATYAPGDANGLYIVEKGGEVTRYDTVAGTSYTMSISDVSTGGERGVLGLVFHPDYATNGRFFVFVTNGGGDIEVREYSRNGANGTLNNATEEGVILTIEHSESSYHNGGSMAFGPDGLLYIAVGDAQDGDNAQDGATLLGKILRIDVSNTDFGASPPVYYDVPAANVFANPGDGVRGEVFAMGLRNPWRISFDATGNLWIGDVGEDDYEEVNFVAAGSNGGINFGWPVREGAHVYEGGAPGPGTLTDPLYEYSHSVGQSITGGFVYDGPATALQGKYIFGDFVTGKIYALDRSGGTVTVTDITSMLSSPIGGGELASFGLDAQHNLYAVKFGGEVVRLDPQGSGADGADTIDGGAGADSLIGGPGDDVYIVDASDSIVELSGGGTDVIRTAASAYSLAGAANVENLTFIGAGGFVGTGNALANVITGGTGNDRLYGAGAVDTLIGGLGDDTYLVDVAGIVTTEGSGAGTDTVRSAISWTLGANIENLTLTNQGNTSGTGNGLSNYLLGNSGANTLSGLGGSDTLYGAGGTDTLIGGTGDDTYLVNLAGVVTTENSGEGTDTVRSAISWTLAANVENLTLTDRGNTNGTGNGLNNYLLGNTGANTLSGLGGADTLYGAGGADTLIGGAGDDTYLVNASNVVILENSGEGTDTVRSAISWTLGANVNNLTLTDHGDTNAFGNIEENVIIGNAGNNVLKGFEGDDTLNGAGGTDTASYTAATGAVTVSLLISGAQAIGADQDSDTLISIENVTGSLYDDLITGNTGANVLNGYGGADTLNGGGGADVLAGGAGADRFVFNSALGAGNIDRITDFAVGADTIALDDAIFGSLSVSLTAGQFRIGTAAADANDYIIYNSSTGGLFYDSNGNGAGGSTQIATLSAGLALTAADFLII